MGYLLAYFDFRQHICLWLSLCSCPAFPWHELSITVCFRQLDEAGSWIQMMVFVGAITDKYSLRPGIILLSSIQDSVLYP